MNPWFIWKDKNSLGDFGLWISKLPKRVRPEERHEEVEIPGRAGSLLMLEGDDVYSSYTAEMIVTARNSLQIDSIVEWLRGSSDLVLSTDIDKARPARIVGEVAFERVGNWLQQATIPFLFQPFRKNRYPVQDDRIVITQNENIFNPGDVVSKPTVKVEYTGSIDISVGGKLMGLTDVPGEVTIDCEAGIITHNGSIWSGSWSGDFLEIGVGRNVFAMSRPATITIDPNWRWL